MLEQLLKYLPKREEMDSLAPYKNKISELSDAEQFAIVVSDIEIYNTNTSGVHNIRDISCIVHSWVGACIQVCTYRCTPTVHPHTMLLIVHTVDE